MIRRPRDSRRRRGAVTLEFSLALPILLILSLGLSVLGQGVSQFQMIADMAREGARYGSVRGAEYAQTTGKPAATAADIYNNAILPRAADFAPGSLTSTVTWYTDSQLGNMISVTVNYQWVPTAYLGTINMTSTSVMMVSY